MPGSKSSPPVDIVPPNQTDQPTPEAVSFTVHSMPDVASRELRDGPSTRAGRLKMMLLLLVCAAPVIASYFTYYVIRPEGRRNHGELIDPQRPIPDVAATTLEGRTVRLTGLKGQWLIVSVSGSRCDTTCEKNLYLSRQLRTALGKDKERVDWVWLRSDAAEVPAALLPAISAATVLQVAPSDLDAWLQPAAGHALNQHVYVVDPMGNWMMRFVADDDPKKMLKDLERLMRGSASWDLAGRP